MLSFLYVITQVKKNCYIVLSEVIKLLTLLFAKYSYLLNKIIFTKQRLYLKMDFMKASEENV